MMNTKTISFDIDSADLENAEKALSKIGWSLDDALHYCVIQIGKNGNLPSELPPPAPENLMVHSKEELIRKLEEAEQSFKEGRGISFEEFQGNIRRRLDELRS